MGLADGLERLFTADRGHAAAGLRALMVQERLPGAVDGAALRPRLRV